MPKIPIIIGANVSLRKVARAICARAHDGTEEEASAGYFRAREICGESLARVDKRRAAPARRLIRRH
jgi:hypothetical protein